MVWKVPNEWDQQTLSENLLETADVEAAAEEAADAADGGLRAGEGRDDRDLVADAGAADLVFVLARGFAERGVDDEMDVAVLDRVDDMGTSLDHLVHRLAGDAVRPENGGGAAGGVQGEGEFGEVAGDGDDLALVGVVDGDEDVAL